MMMIPRPDNGSGTDRETEGALPPSIISDYLHLIGRVRAPIYLRESPMRHGRVRDLSMPCKLTFFRYCIMVHLQE